MNIGEIGSMQLSRASNNLDSLKSITKERGGEQNNFSLFMQNKLDESKSLTHEARGYKVNPQTDDDKKLYEQCEALETFLLKNLISGMRKTVQKSEFSKGGFAGEMYEDMLYDEYAKDFSKNAGFGFAELAYLELKGQRGKVLSESAF
ncbi:MAG: hypothetical protein Ta2G_11600 [Termitinemataceae bacterium]|nr:MAG: hypothetical protein Ta2G_11600 [Termitinemataceae bacterium]